MNIILDIDETFVQFVGKDDWLSIPKEQRDKYEQSDPTPDNPKHNGLFIFRPHLKEFLGYLFDNASTVNLWTLSDRDYAHHVAGMIKHMNPKWKISNIWCDEDSEKAEKYDSGYSKDLEYLWDHVGIFKRCDTILIDDLKSNVNNSSNKLNSIQLKAFNVLGEKLNKNQGRTPTKIRSGHYTDLSKDDTLLKVIDVLKNTKNRCGIRPFDEITKVGVTDGGRRRKTRRYRGGKSTRRR